MAINKNLGDRSSPLEIINFFAKFLQRTLSSFLGEILKGEKQGGGPLEERSSSSSSSSSSLPSRENCSLNGAGIRDGPRATNNEPPLLPLSPSFSYARLSISLSLPPLRFIFYPRQRLVQVFFHTVEMIGFLFPSPPLVGSTPRKSILLLLLFPPPLLVRWFFIEKEASCQIWRFISTRLGRLSLSPFRLPLRGVEEQGGRRELLLFGFDRVMPIRYFYTRDLSLPFFRSFFEYFSDSEKFLFSSSVFRDISLLSDNLNGQVFK